METGLVSIFDDVEPSLHGGYRTNQKSLTREQPSLPNFALYIVYIVKKYNKVIQYRFLYNIL